MSDHTAEPTCGNCGAALPGDAADGSVCVECAAIAPTLPDPRASSGSSQLSGGFRSEPQPALGKVGDFEVLDKLGQGGMGAVYRARQVSLDRIVALKVLPAGFDEDENYVTRFQREATMAASLHHPNLVHVYSSGFADGCHYIAMELVEGENLRQYLRRTGPMPPLEALRICLDVARGLQCGWQKAQLIHRDVKPSNIYLAAGETVKLGDLGLAKSLLSNTTGVTHTGTAIGTPHYISPEQARGEKGLDLRADIYSLGCTLYELLTGATPYQGSDPMTVMGMHIHNPPPAILKVLPQLPNSVGRIVNKMLRKAKHERYQSYGELITAIETAMEQLQHGPTGPSPIVAAWKEIGKAEQGFFPARGPSSSVEKPSSPSIPTAPAGARRTPRTALWTGIAAAVFVAILTCWWVINSGGTKSANAGGRAASSRSALPKASPPQPDSAAHEAAARGTVGFAEASKERPFINSLGMKFVPVPITGGATDGQRVLFSIWETRVQDYQVFAEETGREWKSKSPRENEPLQPKVNVTWDEARSFAQWLTNREQKLGQIGPKERYRLPSDHEWSCAIGIGEKEDAAKTPVEKTQRSASLYPWGNAWPPPPGGGNFRGEEAAADKAHLDNPMISGYRDEFAFAAPVGSFAPNVLGLFDLSGNVGEWCEDWFDGKQTQRVYRGGSYAEALRELIRSDFRGHVPPDEIAGGRGFRLVLARGE